MAFNLLLALHLIAAALWLGGLACLLWALPPALAGLDTAVRHRIWVAVYRRFFPWVWGCIVILLGSGFIMLSLLGGFAAINWSGWVMLVLGIAMTVVFKFAYIAPYRHLARGVDENKPAVAEYALTTLRWLALANLVMGVVIILVAVF